MQLYASDVFDFNKSLPEAAIDIKLYVSFFVILVPIIYFHFF